MHGKDLHSAYHQYLWWSEHEKNHRPATIQNCRDIIGNYLKFLVAGELTEASIRDYLDQNGHWSVGTRSDVVRRLRAFCNWLLKYEYIPKKINIEMPKQHKVHKEIPPVKLLLEDIIAGTEPGITDGRRSTDIKRRARISLEFILVTGLRVSELLAIKSDDFFLNEIEPKLLVHCKGGGEVLHPFPRTMISEVKPLIDEGGKTFRNTEAHLNDCLQRGAEINGREYRERPHVHMLRHAYAVDLLEHELPIQVVSKLLRHDTISTTEKYYANIGIGYLSKKLHSHHSLLQETMTFEERYNHLLSILSREGFDLKKWGKVKMSNYSDRLEIVLFK